MGTGFRAAEWIKFWDYVFECQFSIVNKIHVELFSPQRVSLMEKNHLLGGEVGSGLKSLLFMSAVTSL